MQSMYEVENRSWLVNLPKTYSFYISFSYPMTWGIIPISQSKNNKNSVYIWKLYSGVYVGTQLISFLIKAGTRIVCPN